MKYRLRWLAAVMAVLTLLSACGQKKVPASGEQSPTDSESAPAPLVLTVAVGELPEKPIPSACSGSGSETLLYHLYENLMRWENDGNGGAVLVPGQAESFTTETDYLGNTTYTFTLRDDIFWSDGQAVSAYHFVSAWQSIADPAVNSPYRELMSCISGYDAVQESGDPTRLGVSATNSRTLIVTLNGSAPYFLRAVCASPYTMPVRTFTAVGEENKILTNGAYTVAEFSADGIVLLKSATYYGAAEVTVDELRFVPCGGSEADYEKLQAGTLDFVVDLPDAAVETLAQNAGWRPEPVTSTCGFVFNTLSAPFDSDIVRAAFRLVIDETAFVNSLGDKTLRPAVGLIPYGVSDYCERSTTNTSGQNSAKPQLQLPGNGWDFRAHSEEIVTVNMAGNHAADCEQARRLLSDAGYPDGSGFPPTEYIYIDSAENRTIAQLLQSIWEKELGVTVTLRGVTVEEYALLTTATEETGAAFQIAAMEFTAETYADAGEFLFRWRSSDAGNIAGYSSAAFDILMNAAAAAVAPASYDAYLHDAEAILIKDAPVVPLFYRGGTYAAADDLSGLYRAPNGVFFFSHVTGNTK